jgi:hypothetical protein
LLPGPANQPEETRAFQLWTSAAYQNNQTVMRHFLGQREKVVSVTRDHDAFVLLRCPEYQIIGGLSWQHIRQPHCLVTMSCKSILDRGGDVVVEKEPSLIHGLFNLRKRQVLDFGPMIFVVGKTFVNLRAAKIGKRGPDFIDIAPEEEIGDHIVHADAGAFDAGVSAANPVGADDVAVVSCGGFHCRSSQYNLNIT